MVASWLEFPFTARARGYLLAAAVVPLTTCEGSDADGFGRRNGELTAPAPDTLEGRLGAELATRWDGTTDLTHTLEIDGEIMTVHLEGADLPAVGSLLRVPARATETPTSISEVTVVSPPPQPLIDAEPRPPRTVAFVMVHWPGNGPNDLTREEARERVFFSEQSTTAFYAENSFGIETLTGDVFGWYEIPTPPGCGNGDARDIADAAREAMAANGVDPEAYEQTMVYFARWDACGWSGMASVGSPDNTAQNSYYNGSSGCVVLAQELGHNYGMLHSRNYSCTDGGADVAYSDDCEYAEYGDPFDPMGGGCGHVNVFQKGYMSWIQDCNTVTVTEDGRFNLVPTELACNGTQALRFTVQPPDPDSPLEYYYLEYRQPLGAFDSEGSRWPNGMAGILVHLGADFNSGSRNSRNPYLLDMTPGSDDGSGTRDHRDGWMREGDSYTDHNGLVTFSVVAEYETHAVIDVTFPDGGSGAPTCAGGGTPIEAGGAIGSLECGGVIADEEPPTVTITSPADGTEYAEGASFSVTADAMDDQQVVQVELLADGTSLGQLTEPPYEWDLTNAVPGTYVFVAAAFDTIHRVESEAVTVTVVSDEPPDTTGGSGGGGGSSGGDSSGSGGGVDTDSGGGPGTAGGGGNTDGWGGGQNDAGEGCGCRTDTPAPAPLLAWPGIGGLVLIRPGRRRRTPRAR